MPSPAPRPASTAGPVPAPGPAAGPAADPDPTRRRRPRRAAVVVALLTTLVMVLAACSSPADDDAGDAEVGPALSTPEGGVFPDGTTVRLLAHDSFAVSEEVLDQFTQSTNVEVELVLGGDAVTLVNQAVLTAGNPQGDVLFGVDGNTLTRAVEADIFESYEPEGLADIDPAFTADAGGVVTPVDYGDVCVNYDRTWFEDEGLALPTGFEDLVDPAYRDLLVVQDPSSSSPGLAFLLGTIAEMGGGDVTGDDAPWLDYWRQLQDNGVQVADSWSTAYYTDFSGSEGQGPRPLVVSYASSPPAEVTDPSIPVDEAPTGTVVDTCYRQVEYAGILRGTTERGAAEALIDFMISVPFQEDVPEQMYVYPVNDEAALPEVFETFTAEVSDPLTVPPAEVAANTERWVQQWAGIFR
ncbi:thiamine ABC transporter substrate-binding protein [Rhabdothermincola salaria]|uniref:thiamine ABC transporter substrate-binding protein n=1 Tax=Rhabdothermincola salaria TaxID=2903142 RepID=UPI001E5DCF15|nr:thiamine ABC transporter substrate-binding protein [Rhabdothermincola salaria]MCD9622813.1 thiamine ABC transporter substrate-binding protein [Rhabdothermincola salaria]